MIKSITFFNVYWRKVYRFAHPVPFPIFHFQEENKRKIKGLGAPVRHGYSGSRINAQSKCNNKHNDHKFGLRLCKIVHLMYCILVRLDGINLDWWNGVRKKFMPNKFNAWYKGRMASEKFQSFVPDTNPRRSWDDVLEGQSYLTESLTHRFSYLTMRSLQISFELSTFHWNLLGPTTSWVFFDGTF
jgi:hypothetical protein